MMEFLKLHNFELQKTSKYFQTNDAFKNCIFSLICITVHSSKFFHIFVSFFNSGVCDYRSSCWQTFFKIGVLKNFAKFTGKHKHMCRSLFFNSVAALKLLARCFPVNFVKFYRASPVTTSVTI